MLKAAVAQLALGRGIDVVAQDATALAVVGQFGRCLVLLRFTRVFRSDRCGAAADVDGGVVACAGGGSTSCGRGRSIRATRHARARRRV